MYANLSDPLNFCQTWRFPFNPWTNELILAFCGQRNYEFNMFFFYLAYRNIVLEAEHVRAWLISNARVEHDRRLLININLQRKTGHIGKPDCYF